MEVLRDYLHLSYSYFLLLSGITVLYSAVSHYPPHDAVTLISSFVLPDKITQMELGR